MNPTLKAGAAPGQRPQGVPTRLPFTQLQPVRGLGDVRRIEADLPLTDALATPSTHELFCQSAAAFGDKTAIQFAAGTPAALVELCSEVVARLGLKATALPPGAASSGSPSAACPSSSPSVT